ncbi:MAG: acetyl-CoA synthase subunit gamma [Chloroflexi bacterium]|nr:acetyl-CoA synthase subunit gamma [Chloroflexota bacterium]
MPHWITGYLETPAGKVPRVSSRLKTRDILGFWRMRWKIGRMNYKVQPGLYTVGEPGAASPVLVSANYKMSFDILRRAMAGYDVWLLVVDTRGVNVWCASGKGTFCAGEILRCLSASRLDKVLSKGTMVLPQLCGTGVERLEVQKQSGFRVVFGPVRAKDLPAFLDRGMQATPAMRQVHFGLVDRLVLTPAELVWSLKYLFPMLFLLFVLGGASRSGFSLPQAFQGLSTFGPALAGAVLTGTVVTPVLLPWVPGRSFSAKGCLAGLAWALPLVLSRTSFLVPQNSWNVFELAGVLLLSSAISAFFALNFTGSTPFTSVSAVRKEVRGALPFIVASVIIGGAALALGLKIHPTV